MNRLATATGSRFTTRGYPRWTEPDEQPQRGSIKSRLGFPESAEAAYGVLLERVPGATYRGYDAGRDPSGAWSPVDVTTSPPSTQPASAVAVRIGDRDEISSS